MPAAAPVVTGYSKPRQAKGVGEVDEVLSDCGLLRHARSFRIQEPRRTIAAQVGHEHAVSRRGQRRRHLVPRAHIVRKTVEKNDRETLSIARVLVGDRQNGRLGQEGRPRGAGLGPGPACPREVARERDARQPSHCEERSATLAHLCGSRLSVLDSRFSTLGSRLSVLGSRFSVLGLLFSPRRNRREPRASHVIKQPSRA
jgi:hypothetical protein